MGLHCLSKFFCIVAVLCAYSVMNIHTTHTHSKLHLFSHLLAIFFYFFPIFSSTRTLFTVILLCISTVQSIVEYFAINKKSWIRNGM